MVIRGWRKKLSCLEKNRIIGNRTDFWTKIRHFGTNFGQISDKLEINKIKKNIFLLDKIQKYIIIFNKKGGEKGWGVLSFLMKGSLFVLI